MSMPTLPPVTAASKHTRVGPAEAPVADAFAALLAGVAAPVGQPIVAPAPVPAVTADDESTVAPVDAPAALQGMAAFVLPMALTPVAPSSTEAPLAVGTVSAAPVAEGAELAVDAVAVPLTELPLTATAAGAVTSVPVDAGSVVGAAVGAASVEAATPTATPTPTPTATPTPTPTADADAALPAATTTTTTTPPVPTTVPAKVLPPTASDVAVARVAQTPASTNAAKHTDLPAKAQGGHDVLHRGLAIGKNRLPQEEVPPHVPLEGLTTRTVQLPQGGSPVPAVDGPTAAVQPALVEAANHLKTEGGKTSLIIRLDPPELGAVLVRLTVKDGQVDVHLRTPDLAAQGDLRAQQLDVQQVLREQGLDLTGFHVSHGEAFTPNEGRQTPDRATPRRTDRADGHASTAHVMDDVTRPQPAGTWL